MRLTGYARQSRTDKDKVPSTSWQATEIREWAEKHGHEVVRMRIDEDRSGYRTIRREGFLEVLNDLNDPAVEGVIVWRLDRLSRQGQWGADVIRFMEAKGDKALFSVQEDIDTTTAVGELVLGIRLSMAKAESEAISARSRAGLKRRAAAGHPHSGGSRPFGHTRDRKQVIAEEAALIAEAARRILAGESMRSVVMDWNDRGVVTSTGGKWSSQGMRDLLLQPRLTGRHVYRGKVIAEDAWPAILDDITAARLAAVLNDPKRRPNAKARSYLLSGLVRCGVCGERMHGKSRPRGARYECAPAPDGCSRIGVVADRVDAEVTARVLQAVADGTIPPVGGVTPVATAAIAQLEANQAAREAAAGDHFAGILDRRTYLSVLERLDREDDELRATAATVEGHRRRGEAPAGFDRWEAMSVDQRRGLLTALISAVVVEPRGAMGVWDPTRVRIEWVQ